MTWAYPLKGLDVIEHKSLILVGQFHWVFPVNMSKIMFDPVWVGYLMIVNQFNHNMHTNLMQNTQIKAE